MMRSSEKLMLIPDERRLRFCLAAQANWHRFGTAASAQARAQIDRTQPRAALGRVFRFVLLQVRDLWSGLDGRSQLAQLWIFDVVRRAVTLHARSSTIKPITCCRIDRCLSFASIG